jgi:hypothetical protein
LLSILAAWILCGACVSVPRTPPGPIPEGMLEDDGVGEDALHLPGTDRRWALETPRGQAQDAASPAPPATAGDPATAPEVEAPERDLPDRDLSVPRAPQTGVPVPPAPAGRDQPEAGATAPPPPEARVRTAEAPESSARVAEQAPPAVGVSSAPAPAADVVPAGPLRVPRGEGLEPILVPREERLLYRVYVSLGWLGQPSVGRVQLISRVEPFRASALAGEAPGSERGERGVLIARAWGSYSFYELDETITTLLLPQEWPAVIHRSTQTGTENRRRELRMGNHPEHGPRAWFRSDRHCPGCDDRAHFVKPGWAWQQEQHCKRCKRAEHRVWKPAQERPAPGGAVDMLSAVLLARAMIEEGRQEMRFLLLDKLDLWEVAITRGADREIDVPAGLFSASQVILRTAVPPGEQDRDPEDFEGLFGIRGDISIWFERHTGIPLQISGKIPAGPLRLEVSINLAEIAR